MVASKLASKVSATLLFLLLLVSSGCNRPDLDSEQAQKAKIPDGAKRYDAVLENSASIAWSDYLTATAAGNAAVIDETRAVFIDKHDQALRHLLRLLEEPTASSSEIVLALKTMNEAARNVNDGGLLHASVANLLDLREKATSPEIRDACTQSIAPLLDRAIQSSPRQASLYYFRGDERLAEKEYDSAIEDFSKALEIDEGFTNAYYLRGLANRGKRENAAAIVDFSEALKLNPKYPDVLVVRAATYLDLSQPHDALTDLNDAVSLKPNWSHAYKLRAHAYQVMGDEEKAKEELAKAEESRMASQSDVQ